MSTAVPTIDLDAIKTTELTEAVSLPSKGFGYDPSLNIPATVHLRPIKGGEEALLTSNNYTFNTLITVLLGRCLIEKFDPAELWESDRIYLIFKLRSISYTAEYGLNTTCDCGSHVKLDIDLDEVTLKELQSPDELTAEVILPSCKKKVVVKCLTGKDREVLQKKAKNNKNEAYIDEIAFRIQSVEGLDNSYAVYKRFVYDLIGKDSLAIRDAIQDLNFGLLQDYTADCDSCGVSNTLSVEVTPDFFRPKRRVSR